MRKPARIGVWHYQLVVYTKYNEPFLVATRTHNKTKDMGESIATSEILCGWADLMMSYHPKSVLIADSYFLDLAGRRHVQEKSANIICAMNPSRVSDLDKYIKTGITDSGQTNYAYNQTTNESACYHWSTDTKIGKKLVLTTAFKKVSKSTKKGALPAFDHYKGGFQGCDNFNRAIHGRTWPFRSGSAGKEGINGNIFNYHFTALLINTWHVYCALQKKQPKDVPFDQFTLKLAKGIVNTMRQP